MHLTNRNGVLHMKKAVGSCWPNRSHAAIGAANEIWIVSREIAAQDFGQVSESVAFGPG